MENLAFVLHWHFLLGVAVKVAEPPEQIVTEFTETVGAGFTVTVPVPVTGVFHRPHHFTRQGDESIHS